MEWIYDDDLCVWGGGIINRDTCVFDCKCYDQVRRRWMRTWDGHHYTFLCPKYNTWSNSSFVSSHRVLPFVYTFSGIFVELLKVIQSAWMCN